MSAVAGGDFFLNSTLLASCLTLLVPVSWWLLISRVIHAETLVRRLPVLDHEAL